MDFQVPMISFFEICVLVSISPLSLRGPKTIPGSVCVCMCGLCVLRAGRWVLGTYRSKA